MSITRRSEHYHVRMIEPGSERNYSSMGVERNNSSAGVERIVSHA